MFGIGSVAQLLTLYMVASTTLSQRQLAIRPNLYLHLPKLALAAWRLYAGLAVAFAGHMIYVIFYDGRNPIIICAMAVATSAGFGYAAVGFYKGGETGDAVVQIGFGLSFIGYSGMMLGPDWVRMTAATLMLVGAVGAVLATVFLPTAEEKTAMGARRA
jgi:hypothetical protein